VKGEFSKSGRYCEHVDLRSSGTLSIGLRRRSVFRTNIPARELVLFASRTAHEREAEPSKCGWICAEGQRKRGTSLPLLEACQPNIVSKSRLQRLFQEFAEDKASCSGDTLRDMRSHLCVVRKSLIAGIAMLPTDLPLTPARS
jgi:hypothetical protein